MTAEYSLLPASTGERTDREAARGKQGGRTVEIQRLIGRAVGGVIDFAGLRERTGPLDVVDGVSLLDLDYVEDSAAEVDLNVVMTGDGMLVEVQATAERVPFDRERLAHLLDLAADGIEELAARQQEAVDAPRE